MGRYQLRTTLIDELQHSTLQLGKAKNAGESVGSFSDMLDTVCRTYSKYTDPGLAEQQTGKVTTAVVRRVGQVPAGQTTCRLAHKTDTSWLLFIVSLPKRLLCGFQSTLA